MTNFYEVLGLNNNTSDTEIKKAYRKLSLKFHPDKNPGDTYFEDWAKKINEAFEVLGNPATRAEYDQQLSGQSQTLRHHFQPASQQADTATAAQPATAAAEQVSAAEKLVLRQIKDMLPDYLQLKKEYRAAKLAHQQIKKKAAPPIFTRRQLLIVSVIALLAISGLIYAAVVSVVKADKAVILEPLPGKELKK